MPGGPSMPCHEGQIMRTLTALLLALAPAAAHAHAPFPGGTLDVTGRTAYLSAPDGLVAIDLAGGEVRWRTGEATEPLFVAGERLFALAPSAAGRLFVRAFDLNARGKRVFESDPIDLPRWAVPENGPGRSFSFTWKRDGKRVALTWHVAAWAAGTPRKEASGAAVVELDTGKARAEKPAPPAAAATPAVLERLTVRWQRSDAGRLRAVVVVEPAESRPDRRLQALSLRQWDERTGRASESVELMRGRTPILMQDVDGKKLWLRDSAGGPDAEAKDGRWVVADAGDGRVVARVPAVPGTTSATLIDRRAYCLTVAAVKLSPHEPARSAKALVAVDVDTGKVLWKRVAR